MTDFRVCRRSPCYGLSVASIGVEPLLVVLPAILPQRRLDVEVAEFDTESVVFDPHHRVAHRLDGWLAGVLDACDGKTSAQAFLGECVMAGLDGPSAWGSEGELRRQLATALESLDRSGLLAGTKPAKPPPCIGCKDDAPSRRGRRFLAR